MSRVARVRSGEVELHVVSYGAPGKPPVLLVHGFPDCHAVYSEVAADLARDHHVVAFDLRGVGESTAPEDATGYRIDAILPDLSAVADACFGSGSRFHLVGHDWGSVLGFSYVAEGPDRDRALSFTSVSGPHVRMMWDAAFRNARSGGWRGAASQAAASWYVFALHLPRLPEALFELAGPVVFRRILERSGVPAKDPYLAQSRDEVLARSIGTMNLYRQNALRPPPMPSPRSITTPIRLVVPTLDPFVRPESFAYLRDYATDVVVDRVEASHWLPRSHPALFASAVRTQVADVARRSRDAHPRISGRS